MWQVPAPWPGHLRLRWRGACVDTDNTNGPAETEGHHTCPLALSLVMPCVYPGVAIMAPVFQRVCELCKVEVFKQANNGSMSCYSHVIKSDPTPLPMRHNLKRQFGLISQNN